MLEHISETLKKIKVISKHFVCPVCKEDQAYTYFDYDLKLHCWRCTFCESKGNLRDLANLPPKTP